MFEELVDIKVGQVVHRVIGAAVRDDLDVNQTTALLDRLWNERPIGGTTAWQTRTRAHLAVSVYLRKLRPIGWELLGCEMGLGSAIADLVWCWPNVSRPVHVFIEEVKTGRRPLSAPELPGQVKRLHDGGKQSFGDVFAGVRVAETSHASHSRFWLSDGETLTPVDGPHIESARNRR